MRVLSLLITFFLTLYAYANSGICIVFTSYPDGDAIENVKFYNNYQSALDEAIERSYNSYSYYCEDNNYLMCPNALTTLDDIHNCYFYLSDEGFDYVEWHDIRCGFLE